MPYQRMVRKSRLRRASVMIQTVLFGSAVGVSVAALAIDSGLMYNAKQELQNAADAAALAAASQLGAGEDPTQAAAAEAALFAARNTICGAGGWIDMDADVVFGHSVLEGEKYVFQPNEQPYDSARVTIRRDASVEDGPISTLFARAFGAGEVSLAANATAMLVPRDISIVCDLSGSMNDDSELQHYDMTQINLKDIWLALPIPKGNAGVGNGLDPPPPGNPHSENDQPGTGPGAPANAGGNPYPGADPGSDDIPRGPRWGWLTGWGEPIVQGEYDPVVDGGLYYIPKGQACTDEDVAENLETAGYYPNERAALLNPSAYESDTAYRNRVKVMLGLAGWKSKQKDGNVAMSKYSGGSGNGNNTVDTNELCQAVSYPFSGSWDSYVSYMMGSSAMRSANGDFRYRYGLKTFINYLLESRSHYSQTDLLWSTPEQPIQAVKDAVEEIVTFITDLQSADHLSLEVYATTSRHEVDLTEEYAQIVEVMNHRQSNHYDNTTCIGCGLAEAIEELQSERTRSAAAKIIILLTDGIANVDPYGSDPPGYALSEAQNAADEHMTIYTVSVGAGADQDLMQEIADIGHGSWFHAEGSVDEYSEQLRAIFRTLGGKRPVRLID